MACDTAWHELIVGGERFAATARSKTASFVPVWIVEESGGGTTGAGWWCAGAVEAAGEGWMIEIEGEAAGLGRQRHGAGAEVAAPGALHLAPIRDGVAHLSVTQLAMPLDGLEWARV